MKRVAMRADDNCLFRALSHQFFRTEDNHALVRASCVEEIRTNPGAYRPFLSGETARRYAQRMSRDGEWGDEIVLRAAARAFGRKIRVVDARTGRRTRYRPVRATGPAVTILFSGNHYDSTEARSPGVSRAELERVGRERVWEIDEARSSDDVVSWAPTLELPRIAAAVEALPPRDPLRRSYWNLALAEPDASGLVRCHWVPSLRRDIVAS